MLQQWKEWMPGSVQSADSHAGLDVVLATEPVLQSGADSHLVYYGNYIRSVGQSSKAHQMIYMVKLIASWKTMPEAGNGLFDFQSICSGDCSRELILTVAAPGIIFWPPNAAWGTDTSKNKRACVNLPPEPMGLNTIKIFRKNDTFLWIPGMPLSDWDTINVGEQHNVQGECLF